MGELHTVVQGEHLARIARRYGFRDPATIWDHPKNAELKKKRQNPNVLFPGDTIYVPDKSDRPESVATGQRHRFQVRKRKTLKLSLVLKDYDDKPLARAKGELHLADTVYQVTTGADGKLEQEIRDDVAEGLLLINGKSIPLKIGHLDPVDELPGWRARLNNLGYNAGSSDDPSDPQLRAAVEEFQCDHGLAVDGSCGPKTQSRLKQVHGC